MKLGKRQRWFLGVAGALVLMAATIPAAIWITNTQSAKLGNGRARCARGPHPSRTMTIRADRFVPDKLTANKCDVLIIVNLDDRTRLIAFGPHEDHISYDGVSERVIGRNQSLTVTLVTPGTFIVHDHADPAVRGTFTVKDR